MKEILTMQQGSPKWFELRKNKLNASDTPVVMGLSPYKTAEELAKEKLGLSKQEITEKQKEIFSFGNTLEPLAREITCEILKSEFKPLVYVSGEYLASLDGVCEELNIGIEIKCPYSPTSQSIKLAKNNQVDPPYLAQIQHQLMVSELDKITYCVFDFHSEKAKEFMVKYNATGELDIELANQFSYFIDIKADLKYQAEIQKAWDLFIASLTKQEIQASSEDLSLAEEYSKLEQAKKQIETRQQAIKNCLIAKAKSDNLESLKIANLTVKRNVGGGQFQIEQARQVLEQAGINIEQYCKPKFNWYSIEVGNV